MAITAAAVGGLNLPQASGTTSSRGEVRAAATAPETAASLVAAERERVRETQRSSRGLVRVDASRLAGQQAQARAQSRGSATLRSTSKAAAASQGPAEGSSQRLAARQILAGQHTVREFAAAVLQDALRADALAAARRAADVRTASSASSSGASPDSSNSNGSGSSTSSSGSSSGWMRPVATYHLSSGFGASGRLWSHRHTGQDFAAPYGTSVRAVGSGVVISAGWDGAYGNKIVVRHADGTTTWYCHLSSFLVTGGSVSAGQTIGRVGSTGNATGNHLHFEVHPGAGDAIDPVPWLRSHGVGV